MLTVKEGWRRIQRNKVSGVFFVLVVCVCCAIPAAPCFAADEQKLVAKVNSVAITDVELERAIDFYVPPGTFHGGVGQDREQFRKPALDLLIERELLYQEARRRGMTPDPEEVDRTLEDIKKRYKSEGAFDAALERTGLTLGGYEKVLGRNQIIERLLKEEVQDKAALSEKDLESYYEGHKEKFMRPQAFKVRHILVKVSPSASDREREEAKEKAANILKRLKAGEDFAVLAQQYSDDEYRVKGGDLGWVHTGRLERVIEEAAANLEVGDSAMVESIYGYQIIKLEDTRPSEQRTFAEVRDSLRIELAEKRKKDLKDGLISSLKAKAEIEVF